MDILARVYCATAVRHGAPQHSIVEGTVDGDVNCEVVTFKAIYSSSEQDPNRSYSAATPNLDLSMTITNPLAIGVFVPGKIYDLKFSPVTKT